MKCSILLKDLLQPLAVTYVPNSSIEVFLSYGNIRR